MPLLNPGEISVDVTACTLCGSDLHSYAGHRTVPMPSILGHEAIGRIREFGPEASRVDFLGTPLSIGDRVTWGVAVACGNCFYCERGLPQKCLSLFKYGHEKFAGRPDGGLTSLVFLRKNTAIFCIPDHLSDETACPANCATATVVAALKVAGELSGRTVLVQGAGMLGLTACAMLHRAGAEVICVDPDQHRRNWALRFGAQWTASPAETADAVKSRTQGHGVDAAFEFSGAGPAIPAGLASVRIGGSFVLVGAVFPTQSLTIEPEQFIRRHLRMFGIHNYTPSDLGEALKFLSQHSEYPFDEMVSRWFPLRDVTAAIEYARLPGVMRVGIRPAE